MKAAPNVCTHRTFFHDMYKQSLKETAHRVLIWYESSNSLIKTGCSVELVICYVSTEKTS